VGVLPLVLVLVVHRRRLGDRAAVHEDGAALGRVAGEDRPGVAGVGTERVRREELDRGRRHEERDEHEH
ncbi:hypothetical protein IAE22_37280, partial [Bacillus sp. S34]|nr:hypothetical protein [Bacillus sp. S34]